MPFFRLLLVLLLLAGHAPALAQAAYGDWQLHLPARRPLALALAGRQLYVADESSFYRYDLDLRATQTLSRRDGLSDVGVAALAYDSASAQLVVAYRNGNLDLLGGATGSRVRNVTDLLRKASAGAKTVSQVQIYNGLAYLSTSLGVVVLDLARGEVRDTYSAIGPGGQPVSAFATVVLRDTIFAATSAGILRGRLAVGLNLLDFRSWTAERPVSGNPAQVFTQLAAFRGHVVAGSQFRGLDVLGGVGAARAWRYVNGSYGESLKSMRATGGQLLVAFENAPLRRLALPAATVADVLPPSTVGPAVLDVARVRGDGTLFVASFFRGLLRFGPGQLTSPASGELIRPNGPETALAFGLAANAATNTVDVFPGGYQFNTEGKGLRSFYEYRDGQWTNFTAANFPSARDYPDLRDLTRGAHTADGTLYIGSYGNGLLEWRGPGQFRQFTFGTPGAPLRSNLNPDASNLDFVRVTDVAADPGGRYVWVVNRHQRAGVPGLLRLRPASATWASAPDFGSFDNLERVVVDAGGNPWATISRGSIAAYDTTSRQAYYFGSANGLPAATSGASVRVLSLARDRDGAIWAGTDAGVAVCANPGQLANAADPARFSTPIVPTSGNSGFPALFTETVSCIAVDGANRKWFGTANGLWLFNPAGTEALMHFTTANSPLPSNGIVDVAVNDRSGEVFVATDAGVVSYQGSASLTEGKPSCAQVFPNPVRPDFVGTVGIRGVANDAQVRITDVAGHLVFSTRAAGGTVTWNLTDASGRRVRSGVYLVLSADAQGKNTCVSKVAVLSGKD